jgi:ParB/RepB/Spo0J family partition protein
MNANGLLTVEQVPIDQLRPDPANPRRISEEELDSLERSIRQFGFVAPVLARKEDGTVIGGHQRLLAARRLGLTTIPVTFLDLSIEQARVELANALFEYLEIFHNRQRRHSALRMLTPVEFETRHQTETVA